MVMPLGLGLVLDPRPADPWLMAPGYSPDTVVWLRRLLCVRASITSMSTSVAAFTKISLGADRIS
jgi:hypothetical protein